MADPFGAILRRADQSSGGQTDVHGVQTSVSRIAAAPSAAAPLHVLHVLEAIGGGTAKHLIDVCRAVPIRHTVVVPAARRGELSDPDAIRELRLAGADVRVVPMRRSAFSATNFQAIAVVRKLIVELSPSVVHGHSSVGGAIARIAARGTGVATAWTAHGIMTASYAVLIQRWLGRTTDLAVALSASEARTLIELRLAEPRAIQIIPNGIDRRRQPAPFDLRERLGLPAGCPVVVSIARLSPQKAPLDLVAAAEILIRRRPDVHVVLIGDGELAALVDEAILEKGLGTNFHRLRMDTGASALLPQADAAVLTSVFEGGPYLVLEAFRAGIPMVATSCVGTVDAIEHERTGLLAAPGDVLGLAGQLTRVLDDRELAEALVAAATRRLAERFSIGGMARALEDSYRVLAGLPVLDRSAVTPRRRRTDRSSPLLLA